MPEFTQSWAFAFLLGCIIGGCFGVVLAAILAASGRASRMEERIVGYKSPPKKSRRPNKPTPPPPLKIEIATKNNPRTD